MTRRVLTNLVLLTLLVAALSACNKVKKLEAKPDKKTIYQIGLKTKIDVKALDKKGQPVGDAKLVWSSADPKIAKVSPAGEVEAMAKGQTTITVESGGVKLDIPLKVMSILAVRVSPEAVNLIGPTGSTTQMSVEIVDEDDKPVKEKVTWSTLSPGVAIVSPDGLVTSKGTGSTKVIAALDTVKGEAKVIVDLREIVRMQVHPETTILRVNETQQFSATIFDQNAVAIENVSVLWKSSNPSVATVDANGIVRALNKGTCQIEASVSGKSQTSSVIVN